MTGRTGGFGEVSGRPSRPLTAEVEPPLGNHDRTTSSIETATETSTFTPDRDSAAWSGAARPSPPRFGELVPKHRIPWAELLQRVFEVDALCCPSYGGRMRVLSAITDPIVAARILWCLALPSRAPPMAISRDGTVHSDSEVDGSFGRIPEFDFDQSQPLGDDESST